MKRPPSRRLGGRFGCPRGRSAFDVWAFVESARPDRQRNGVPDCLVRGNVAEVGELIPRGCAGAARCPDRDGCRLARLENDLMAGADVIRAKRWLVRRGQDDRKLTT